MIHLASCILAKTMHCKTKGDTTSSTIEHLVTHIFGWWVQRVCLWDAKRNRKYFCVWFVHFHRCFFLHSIRSWICIEFLHYKRFCAIRNPFQSFYIILAVSIEYQYTINENNHHAAIERLLKIEIKNERSVARLHTWMHFSTYEMNLTSKPQKNHRQPQQQQQQHQHPKQSQRLQSLYCDEPVCGRPNLSV